MKKINRKQLITELEDLRQGFKTAHGFIAVLPTAKVTMRAYHHQANLLVEKYGGEKVDEIKNT